MGIERGDGLSEPLSELDLPLWPSASGPRSDPDAAPDTLRTPSVAIGALDAKTARLVAFAVLIAQGHEAARWHAVLARRYGATLAELEHAVAIASFVGGGMRSFEVAKKALAEVRAAA